MERAKTRIDFLVQSLSKSKDRILIPTPVLAEVLVGAGPSRIPELVARIEKLAAFRVASFDQVAAVELALLKESPKNKAPSTLTPVQTKAKLKFDRQIVAIAKVNSASAIYSDDDGLCNVCANNGLKTVRTWELELPPEAAQRELFGRSDDPIGG